MPCLQLLLNVRADRVTIDILPDDVFLHIFDFIRAGQVWLSWWHQLAHVCRRWRAVILASPNFLDLKLACDPTTRVGLLGIWPPLPIILRNGSNWCMPDDYDFDAAIKHRDRVCEINLFDLKISQLQRLTSVMQEQFPALIHLSLHLDSSCLLAPALPDEFLGGSAPHLQSLGLSSIPFPALPKLLLSATHLVRLSLRNIPHSGYISPEAIITGLAVLTNLKSLTIKFRFALSGPGMEDRRSAAGNTHCPPRSHSF